MIDSAFRGVAFMVVVLTLWLVIKLAGAFFRWLRSSALRDTGRAAGVLMNAGKRAASEVKEGYRAER